jgi:hypothetical protein
MRTSDITIELLITFPKGAQVIVADVYLNVLLKFLTEEIDLF